jgi:hypothetical protein
MNISLITLYVGSVSTGAQRLKINVPGQKIEYKILGPDYALKQSGDMSIADDQMNNFVSSIEDIDFSRWNRLYGQNTSADDLEWSMEVEYNGGAKLFKSDGFNEYPEDLAELTHRISQYFGMSINKL